MGSVDVNWGDSTTHGTASKTSTGFAGHPGPHLCRPNGTYVVTVKVTDKDQTDFGTVTPSGR